MVVPGRHDAETGRILDRRQGDRRLGPTALVMVPEGAHIQVGQDVAVDDEEPLVQPGLQRRKADGTRRVERLRLHRIVQRDAGTGPVRIRLDEGVGPVPERQHHLGHTRFRQAADHALEHGGVGHRQHLLGQGQGEGAQASAETSNQDDRSHGGPISPQPW